MRFFEELKRRKVFTAALTYAAIGWLVIEASSIVLPAFNFPEWTMRFVLIMVVILFPLVLTFSWFFDLTTHGLERTDDVEAPDKPTQILTGPPLTDDAVCSVTVLPFDNLSSSPEDEILADGLATEIHSTLGQMHQVRISSRRSAFSYKNSDKPLEQIATELNVRYVLSGSLQRSGDQLRIIAELDDASNGTQLWSQKFEREIDDLLAIQTEIAEAIVGAFGIERERSEIATANLKSTENLDAWSLLQKARNYINDYSETSLNEAMSLLKKSIALDNDYAAAHAALGSVLIERTLNGYSSNPAEDRLKALESITRAQQLTPRDNFVLKMAGMVFAACGETEASLQALRTCVSEAPFDFGAWGYFGWPLTARGNREDLQETEQIMERLLQTAPGHAGAGYWLYHKSVACSLKEDYAGAKELLDEAFEKYQPIPWALLHLANLLGINGDTDGARSAAERASSLNPKLTIQNYSDCILAMSENNDAAAARLTGLKKAGLLPA
jgi:TolB-like protein/Tfp pilus assembly protein PilF